MKQLRYGAVRWGRIVTLVLMDILIINLAVLLSLVVRFEFDIPSLKESGFLAEYWKNIALWYTLSTLAIFTFCRFPTKKICATITPTVFLRSPWKT